jgi:hypothetical protein
LNLLHAYILEENPSAFVYTTVSWPGETKQSNSSFNERLRQVDPKFPRSNGLTFLLFDEAQDSYNDGFLWNYFLQGVGDGLFFRYRAILFCSYGSPYSRFTPNHRFGSSLVIPQAARISLWPGEVSLGVFLNRSELNEVVSRFEPPLNLHPDLLDLIFAWTVGHAGVVVELLRIVSEQVSP